MSNVFPPLAELARATAPSQPYVNASLQPLVMPVKDSTSLQFVHLLTNATPTDLDTVVRSYGTTTWVATRPSGRCAVITFDWALITKTILTVADPLAIRSNLYLTHGDGHPISDPERFIVLATIVHGLDWYGAVRNYLRDQKDKPTRRVRKASL